MLGNKKLLKIKWYIAGDVLFYMANWSCALLGDRCIYTGFHCRDNRFDVVISETLAAVLVAILAVVQYRMKKMTALVWGFLLLGSYIAYVIVFGIVARLINGSGHCNF